MAETSSSWYDFTISQLCSLLNIPAYNATLQDGSYGPYCVQGAAKGLNLLGPGDQSPVGGAINQFLGGIPLPIFSGGDEDCLFLDVYVPGRAIRNPSLG